MRAMAKAFRGKDGALVRSLLAEAQFDPELAKEFRERWTLPRRKMAAEVFREAIRGGELRPGVEPEDVIDMLYVHPAVAGKGVGAQLCDALEKLAAARGAEKLTADASDTALGFFEHRGFVPQRRNTVPRNDEWLANTTVQKQLNAAANESARPRTQGSKP